MIGLTLALALTGCGGTGGDDGDDAPAVDAVPGTSCDPADVVAAIRVSPGPATSGPFGSQASATVLARRRAELEGVTATVGGCRYYGAVPALCEPACTGGAVCDIHGACVAYDEPIDAGTIAITGGTATVAMEPTEYGGYYATESYADLFAPGAALTVDVEGDGDLAGFTIDTLGVPAIELPTTELTATEHVGLTIEWTPSDVDGAELVLRLDNDHHAGPETLICTAPAAAGTFTVPAEILDQLIIAGEQGIGTYIENAWAQLRRRGTVQTARGCATFDADSTEFVHVETVRAP